MAKDLYDVLGVDANASDTEIKKAYRRLAMQYHPDRNNGEKAAEEKFKEVTEAYEILRDPRQRAQYDRFGMAGVRGGGAGGFGFHHVDLAEALSIFMRDFGGFGGFDSLFGGGERARRAQRRGQDVRATLKLTIEDVAHGVTRKLKLKTLERCDHCGGSGAKPGTSPVQCRTCGGSGEVRRASQSLFGQFVSVSPCPTCGAEGTVVEEPCDLCRGDGRVRQEKEVKVEVPPGVSANNYITLRGQGIAGPRSGPPGDLIVEFEVEEDSRFQRRGDDLVYDLPLSFSQAALGGDVTVPTPYGDEQITVPSGTQSGTVVTLRSRGLPNVSHGRRGSLYVRVQVWTPAKLTPELRTLFEKLAEVEGEPPRDEGLGRWLWEKMKEAFGA
ncbi:MAG: molecular chaperone DnaJ [Gemmatimonadales bacterium]|nr:molecular chaperone DnaJ [Gemmatimonadales bacterium]NIN12199.1 molecular chaperone DnaJ [Gemmatimonadales bacterium]NIN50614.1 molecular chaperone DnaJ [Gemmatimonadales bacterium]NIP08078.1 molecular chaperone DnaJ [Gemmatimonadales bacterium]NIR03368.1 molecular chaperone DnaJ [Gemmatimonadales bacterium]